MTTLPPRIGKPAFAPTVAVLVLAAAVLCLPSALLPTLRAARGGATVAANLSEATVDVGEPAEFRITVTNGDPDETPRAPVVDGLKIAGAGQSSYSQYVFNNNGLSQVRTTTYTFTVDTSKPGRYTIPGQEVRVDGTVLRTLPVTLTVVGSANPDGTAKKSGPVFFELILSKKSAYLGEEVPVEMRANFQAGMQRNPEPNVILNGDGFSVQPFGPPKFARVLSPGSRYFVDSYKTAVAGLKIGTINVGPAAIDPIVRLPLRQRRSQPGFIDPFEALTGDPFDAFSNLGEQRQIHLETPVVPLEVRPLPEAGKPANFSGAIGQFRLEAEAVPAKAQTGDPVTIRLRLSGQGNFDRVAPPVLSDERGLKTYPTTSKFKADDDGSLSGVKTFEQVVITEEPRTTLPPYHFNYLDPATGRYVTVDTPPLAVKIEGNRLATPTPAPTAAPAATPAAAAPTPRPAPEDIHYMLTEPGPRRGVEAFRPLYRRPLFWEIQGTLLAVALALGGVAGWRARLRNASNQRAAQLARQQSDLQRALRREDTGRREFYTAATRLAQLRANADASLSAEEIARVKRLDERTASSVREIFDRHEELAYSGGAAAQTPVPAGERQGVLATLETIGRN